MIRTRNEILSGIGFLISFIVALITFESLSKYDIFYIIIAAVIGLIVFTVINEIMYKKIEKYNKFRKEYVKIIFDEITVLQGSVASMAILETISDEQIIALTEFLSLLTFAQSYTLQTTGYKMLKTEKVEHEPYRQQYMIAKSSLENYKKSDLPYIISRIEKFITDFEENEKKEH